MPSDADPTRVFEDIVLFTASKVTIPVPTPTDDPKDPLKLPRRRKLTAVTLLSLFCGITLSLVSGLGALLPLYETKYKREGASDAQISYLMTVPLFALGASNLICIPLSCAIGRRPVFLASVVLAICGALICGFAGDVWCHLGGRVVLGISAGNTEALVPLMILEIHFLHERSTILTLQSTFVNVSSILLILFASPIATSIGPGHWYDLGAGMLLVVLLFSFLWVPESAFDRPRAAPTKLCEDAVQESCTNVAVEASDASRAWKSIEPRRALQAIKDICRVMLFPDIFWALCLNGLAIGVFVALQSTYAMVLTGNGYDWAVESTSYVTLGGILASVVALPLLGHTSDHLIQWMARKRGGIHKPQRRLLSLVISLPLGILALVIYGQACSLPGRYHWIAIAWAYAASSFCFIGVDVATFTFLLDAYPALAAPAFALICSSRAFVGFGLIAELPKFVAHAGYDGAFGVYAACLVVLGLMAIPIYKWGSSLQRWNTNMKRMGNEENDAHSELA